MFESLKNPNGYSNAEMREERTMKRFLIFANERYYPAGGWRDLIGSTETYNDALDLLLTFDYAEWFQIVDTETGQIVKEKE